VYKGCAPLRFFILLQLLIKKKKNVRNFPSLMETFPPVTPLDWALFCVENICPVVGVSCEENKDQTVAVQTAIEENHPQEVKGACPNPRGRRWSY